MSVLLQIENMAEYGTAPKEGCSLFGVGLDEALGRLDRVYLTKAFQNGRSVEKFVLGPYGSGKTHFLRQLQEKARDRGCVTVEVPLNKNHDFNEPLIVYKEIAEVVTAPGMPERGLRNLIPRACAEVRSKTPDPELADSLLEDWIAALADFPFQLDSYRRVIVEACRAHLGANHPRFDLCCNWLYGNFQDKALCKTLQVEAITRSEHKRYGHKAAFCLYQFVKQAGFHGTVVCFDEAEQSLDVDRRRMQNVLSMLQSGINAVADLEGASVLVLYAITPDVRERFKEFAALEQRVEDPTGQTFWDGNTRATKIELTHRVAETVEEELSQIATRLVQFFMSEVYVNEEQQAALLAAAQKRASQVATEHAGASNRRYLVKAVCSDLMRFHDDNYEPTMVREAEV